jgi:hypothetical protein
MSKLKRMMFIMYFECRAYTGAGARKGKINPLSFRLSQEDQQLQDLVKEHGDKNWVLLTKVWSTTRSMQMRACLHMHVHTYIVNAGTYTRTLSLPRAP